MASRSKLLLENYVSAKKEARKSGDFDIALVNPDSFEEYYILLKPKTGIYRDQSQIIHMKTTYGDGVKYSYPINAPKLTFITKVYHTNISTSGSICLDILKDATKWMPTYDFVQIIVSLIVLYQEPNNSSPFNGEASRAYVDCEKRLKEILRDVRDFKERERLTDLCFEQFKRKADEYASSNPIADYVKWFPQLGGQPVDDTELKELDARLTEMKLRKKASSLAAGASADAASVGDAPAGPAPAKSNRWAKYQKKPSEERKV